MLWLARLSLTNRAIVGLVTVLTVVLGVISTFSLRQEIFPSLLSVLTARDRGGTATVSGYRGQHRL